MGVYCLHRARENPVATLLPKSCPMCGIGPCKQGVPDPYKGREHAPNVRQAERARKVISKVTTMSVSDICIDIFNMFEQLGTAEHAQDRELIRKLRAKYDWDW